MPNPKPSLFLTPLSLGGKLTLVNANFWVIFVLLARNSLSRNLPLVITHIGEGLIVVMGFPLVWFFPTVSGQTGVWAILPTIGLPGTWEMLFAVVILGINSFIWGYGLAWCMERTRRFFRSNP